VNWLLDESDSSVRFSPARPHPHFLLRSFAQRLFDSSSLRRNHRLRRIHIVKPVIGADDDNMLILAGIERGYITRQEGLQRLEKIISFLEKADRFHGAFPHWINGETGHVKPFGQKDNGGDLVETSFLMEGLITARQYFNTADAGETSLRNKINNLLNGVEWNWFRQGGQNVLFWHWSPTLGFIINQPINGWDEALIVYALAASSPVDSNRIPKIVYDNGWALNGGIKNGAAFY
jgi:hypothetical protein